MKRLAVLLCALLFSLGCSSEGGSGQWDDFWKDLRGDNMKMKSDFTQTKALDDQPAPAKPRD
jgi:hypothetical protein